MVDTKAHVWGTLVVRWGWSGWDHLWGTGGVCGLGGRTPTTLFPTASTVPPPGLGFQNFS